MGAQAARLQGAQAAEAQQADWAAWQAGQASEAGPEIAEVLMGLKKVLDGFKMVLRGL